MKNSWAVDILGHPSHDREEPYNHKQGARKMEGRGRKARGCCLDDEDWSSSSESCWSCGRLSRLHSEEMVEEREDEGVEGSRPISSSSSMGDGDSGDQTDRRGSRQSGCGCFIPSSSRTGSCSARDMGTMSSYQQGSTLAGEKTWDGAGRWRKVPGMISRHRGVMAFLEVRSLEAQDGGRESGRRQRWQVRGLQHVAMYIGRTNRFVLMSQECRPSGSGGNVRRGFKADRLKRDDWDKTGNGGTDAVTKEMGSIVEGGKIWSRIGYGQGRCGCRGELNEQVIPFILRKCVYPGLKGMRQRLVVGTKGSESKRGRHGKRVKKERAKKERANEREIEAARAVNVG